MRNFLKKSFLALKHTTPWFIGYWLSMHIFWKFAPKDTPEDLQKIVIIAILAIALWPALLVIEVVCGLMIGFDNHIGTAKHILDLIF